MCQGFPHIHTDCGDFAPEHELIALKIVQGLRELYSGCKCLGALKSGCHWSIKGCQPADISSLASSVPTDSEAFWSWIAVKGLGPGHRMSVICSLSCPELCNHAIARGPVYKTGRTILPATASPEEREAMAALMQSQQTAGEMHHHE